MTTPTLLSYIPAPGTCSDDELLARFVDWAAEGGLTLYPAQEEALLEVLSGNHVLLSTPTGSGKSMVALGMHFKALAEGKRSFYTSPIKALATEKFFDLCRLFGPENVGLLTGDASINPEAPIIGCTQEVLANMSLRMGEEVDAPYVVMDEFHYYGDRDRGWSWQVPLLTLPRTQFLLMSATLGNTNRLRQRIAEQTGREMVEVYSNERPVPLDFSYSEEALQDTVSKLLRKGKAPIYIVNFTHRDCAERAQALSSLKVCDQEERKAIGKALSKVRFSSPYGKDVKRFMTAGIGVHFAGLLPKYRLLTEQLAQKGLLKVICGTDTLGVGVNIPIRTVVFTQLSKFDGEKVRVLRVRDFQQIAGRAGRKGFDDQGSVVAMAPEYMIENKKLAAKAEKRGAGGKGRRPKKFVKKKPPPGFVGWNADTFARLAEKQAEPLESQMRVNHGMILSMLPREVEEGMEHEEFFPLQECGYRRLVRLLRSSHESAPRKRRLLREAAVLFRALRGAGLVIIDRDPITGGKRPFVPASFQYEFSLHQALSLYLIEVIEALDREHPSYALDLLSAVEAILEDPRVVLQQQVRKERDKLFQKLKAQGVPFDVRVEKVKELSYPQPCADFLYETFALFEANHPWVGQSAIHPKGIARDMIEQYCSFEDYVRSLGIQRGEGVLLRYLTQVYKVLAQTVPEQARSEEVYDMLSYFAGMIERIDSSLVDEWELMKRRLEAGGEEIEVEVVAPESTQDRGRSILAQVRRRVYELVRALVSEEYGDALALIDVDDDASWDAAGLKEALEPFYADYEEILFTPEARTSRTTKIKPVKPGTWSVQQTLLDPEGDNFWFMELEAGLVSLNDPDSLRLRLMRIGS